MYYCERCQSRFHSERAASIRDCPRCLLRDDVASPLVPGSPPRRGERQPANDTGARTDPDAPPALPVQQA
jgi:hypothetical protein